MQNNQYNHSRTFLYMIQVQAVLYAVISATSYYRFRGSTSFAIARGNYGEQCNSYSYMQNTGGIDLATYGEARGVSIP